MDGGSRMGGASPRFNALDAVGRHIRPVLTRRVGVRYVNRLSGVEMTGRLPQFIRSELLGLADAVRGLLRSRRQLSIRYPVYVRSDERGGLCRRPYAG